MAGGKSNWNDDPIKKNGVICGRKTFDVSDKSERMLCANELLCRQFLKDRKSTFITNLVVIEPEAVQDILDETDPEKVRCDFWGERERLVKALSTVSGNVTLFIELGTSDTKALFRDYAMDYSHHEAEILAIIRRLFEMVNVMQKLGFVNTDIKADNLIYSERDNEPSLIMNDFDTSFILNTDKGIRFKAIDKHPFTEPAPELVGWHTENRVGSWTDVFIAGILAYRLLNNFDYPRAFVNAKSAISDITERYYEYQRLFNSLSDGSETIEPPENGSEELKTAILNTLQTDPEKRTNAAAVLEALSVSRERSESAGKSAANSPADGDNAYEVVATGSVKRSRSALSYILFALPMIAFIGILSFVIASQLRNAGEGGGSAVTVIGSSPAPVTSLSTVTENTNEAVTAAVTVQSVESSTAKAAETAAITTSKAEDKSGSISDGGHSTEAPDRPSSTETAEPRTEAQPETVPPPTEKVSSPYEYVEKTISITICGSNTPSSVSGIEITGYSDSEGIPSVLEIPAEIDGKKVISIAEDAFYGFDIEELHIPDSVVNIGDRAFCNCPPLWRIFLGKNVSMIGEQAFFNVEYHGAHEEELEINTGNPELINILDSFGDQWDGRNRDYFLNINT